MLPFSNTLKRYPLLVTLPLGVLSGTILGFVVSVREGALIAQEARRANPNDPLDLLWSLYIMLPLAGAFLGMLVGVTAAIIISVVHRKRSLRSENI